MKKVVILGGGPAGLTAAYELLKDTKDEYEVTILEESGVLGGISQTVRYHGNRMDIGGHRFFSKDDTVMKWWSDLMPIQGQPSFDDKKLGRETRSRTSMTTSSFSGSGPPASSGFSRPSFLSSKDGCP